MKIQKNRLTQKILTITAILCILFAGGLIAYKLLSTEKTKNTSETTTDNHDYSRKTDLNSPSDDQKEAGDETKKHTTNNTDASEPEGNGLSVSITAANQNDTTLQIRTLINSVIGNGTCRLDMTKEQAKITRSVDIQALPSNSTCKGFDMPLSELSKGDWKVVITVNSGDKEGSTEKVISIY